MHSSTFWNSLNLECNNRYIQQKIAFKNKIEYLPLCSVYNRFFTVLFTRGISFKKKFSTQLLPDEIPEFITEFLKLLEHVSDYDLVINLTRNYRWYNTSNTRRIHYNIQHIRNNIVWILNINLLITYYNIIFIISLSDIYLILSAWPYCISSLTGS